MRMLTIFSFINLACDRSLMTRMTSLNKQSLGRPLRSIVCIRVHDSSLCSGRAQHKQGSGHMAPQIFKFKDKLELW